MQLFNKKEIREHPFGIKEFSYKKKISVEDTKKALEYLDANFYSKKKISWDRPGYQTPFDYDLLSSNNEQLNKIKDAFFESVIKYVNQKILIDEIKNKKYGLKSWCYMDWGLSDREHKFDERVMKHAHNVLCPDTISGIFYLKLPKGRSKETEFHIGGNKFNLPSHELSWFIFPSNYMHTPAEQTPNQKRYVISADLSFPDLYAFCE